MKEKHPIKNLYYRHFRKGQYIVNGIMTGNIEQSNSVRMGANGIINGNVHTRYANIDGTIHGDLVVDDYVELSPNAQITGQIIAREIIHKEDCIAVSANTTKESAK